MNSFLLILLSIALGHAQALAAAKPSAYVAGTRRLPAAAAKDGLSGAQGRVFPRIIAGSGWETTFVLFNPGSAAVAFQQLFYGSDGELLPFAVHNLGGSEDQTTSGIRGMLGPGSSLRLDLPDTGGAVRQGWSLITYEDGAGVVSGYSILRRKALDGAYHFEITVSPSSMQDYCDYMPFDNTQGFRSQLTLVNPAGNISAQVRLTYMNAQGTVVLMDSVLIPPTQQVTLTIPDTYPDLAGKTGTVLIEADTDRLAVMGMRYHETYGTIARLPTMTGSPEARR